MQLGVTRREPPDERLVAAHDEPGSQPPLRNTGRRQSTHRASLQLTGSRTHSLDSGTSYRSNSKRSGEGMERRPQRARGSSKS